MKQLIRFSSFLAALVTYSAVFFFCLFSVAGAQTGTISGTIVDSLGNAWNGALVTAVFQPAPNNNGPYTWSGGTLNKLPAPVTANTEGQFSIVLPTNTSIVPAGSQWAFSICPLATTQCAVFNYAVTGSADITSVVTSNITNNTVNSLSLPLAYNTSMLPSPPRQVGGLFYNTTTNCTEVYNGTSWSCINASSNTYSPYAPSNAVLVTEGDSITAGFLQPNPTVTDWPAQLKNLPFFAPISSGALHNGAVSGSTCATMTSRFNANVLPYAPNTTGNPGYLIFMIGRNDLATLTETQIENCIDAYTTMGNNAGFKTINLTILPSSLLFPLGPLGTPTATITSFSATSSSATFIATNTFALGQNVALYPFSYGTPYTGFVGTVIAPTNSSEFTLATTGTAVLAPTAVTGTGSLTTYSSWDNISSASDIVRQDVNAYLLRDTTAALVIDTASLISNPNTPLVMYDGTHPVPATDAGMALFIASKLNPSGGEFVQNPVGSKYNPIIQGVVSAQRVCGSLLNTITGQVGDWTANPYGCMYVDTVANGTFIDSFNPITQAYMALVLRGLNINIAPNGVTSALFQYNTAAQFPLGVSSVNGYFGGTTGGIAPTSGTWVNLFSDGTNAVVSGFNYGSGTRIPLVLNGSAIQLQVNGTAIGNVSSAGLNLNGLSIGVGHNITNSDLLPQVSSPNINQAACIKATGPPVVIGYCSTVVGAGGACTCN